MRDTGYVLLAIVTALAFVLVAALTLGCSATTQKPACTDGALARIEAAYVAEILRACDGQHFDRCPERVKIDKRYDALREEWIRCEN